MTDPAGYPARSSKRLVWPIIDRADDMSRNRMIDELRSLYEPPTMPAGELYVGRGPRWWRHLSRRIRGQR